jgi:hypothetical protein
MAEFRATASSIVDRYLDVQQDVLETFVDRQHLAKLGKPTLVGQRRVPGLRLDDDRLLAVMGAILRYKHLATAGTFRTKDLHASVAHSLGRTVEDYKLSQLRYDLGKLRAKGLVEKVPGTQTYRMTKEGYQIAILFLKLKERLLAPLVSGIMEPQAADRQFPKERCSKLDRSYQRIESALTQLCRDLGIRICA